MKYKVGLIGLGRMGSSLEDDPLRGKPASHAGAIVCHPKTRLFAGCDTDPEKLAVFGKRWKVRKLYDDHLELLEDAKPDIISIASWTETHSRIVIDSAESGYVKGIYCEKPIALNLSQAKKMMRACRKNGVAMVVGHERRWDSKYRVIRDMLLKGELGELKSITGYTLSGSPPKLARKKFGGGPMFHDGTHLVDLFRFFGGDVESVIGLEDRPEGEKFIENTAIGMLRFKSGATGLILGGGERKYFHFELDIHTDKARVIVGNHTAKLFITQKSERYTGFTELEEVPFPQSEKNVNALVGGIDDLVREIKTGKPSISSGTDGYKALEIITAMYKSAGNGRSPVKIPL